MCNNIVLNYEKEKNVILEVLNAKFFDLFQAIRKYKIDKSRQLLNFLNVQFCIENDMFIHFVSNSNHVYYDCYICKHRVKFVLYIENKKQLNKFCCLSCSQKEVMNKIDYNKLILKNKSLFGKLL